MIVEAWVRLLIMEHKSNPIQGNVLVLGKQTVSLSLSKILEIFHEQNCPINPLFDINQVKKDESTRMRKHDSIDDEMFFQLFGDVKYHSMDVSEYEQASIIHDLNDPIPRELEGKFDYIIDGGTFDHLFDLKTAFANVVKLLKPNGVIVQWNAASNFANLGYLSFSADYFNDFYVLNKFAECRTFFAESVCIASENWCLYEFIPPDESYYPAFRKCHFYNMVIVIAKKGKNSTYDRKPIQLQYRDAHLKEEYRENRQAINNANKKKQKIKNVSYRRVRMPLYLRVLYFLYPKPATSTYKYIGWI